MRTNGPRSELRYAQLTADNSAASVMANVKVTGVKNNAGPAGEDAVTEITRGVFLPKTPEVFTYDADGNLTGDGKWTYTWDGENRLIRQTARAEVIRAEHRPRLVEFAYDGQGRRVQKKVTASPDYGVAWQVSYYPQPYFSGTPSVAVDYGALNLVQLGGGGILSAIWQGTVRVPATGEWTFKLQESAYYGYRFYLDGVKRFEAWPELGADQAQTVTLALEAGREYPIKLEFSLRNDWRWWMYANVNLKWSGPGVAEQLVPAALSSEAGGSDVVTTTRSLYDGWNLLAEVNAAGAPVRTYAWGSDLSGSMQGAGGVGGLLFSALQLPTSTSTHATAFDGNGNVIGYVDMATGAKSATYEYGAFGETLIADGVAAELFPFRFSTKYTDNETGLLYYGLRYYHPSMGRWLSKDPIEEQGGVNLYGFVENAPTGAVDPLGEIGLVPRFIPRVVPRGGPRMWPRNPAPQPRPAPRPQPAPNQGPRPHPVPPINGPETESDDYSNHYGKFDANWCNVEKTVHWSQPTPLTKTQAFAKLDQLESMLGRGIIRDLRPAFDRIRAFIRKRSREGIPAFKHQSFDIWGTKGDRVDYEINGGRAFTDDDYQMPRPSWGDNPWEA